MEGRAEKMEIHISKDDIYVIKIGNKKYPVFIEKDIKTDIDIDMYHHLKKYDAWTISKVIERKGIESPIVKLIHADIEGKRSGLNEVTIYALEQPSPEFLIEYFEKFTRLRTPKEVFTLKDRNMRALSKYLKRAMT